MKNAYPRGRLTNNRSLRVVLIAVGLCCAGLGVVGIFLPLLPTVPLLLLAAACFARSSERFHRRLIEHRHLGPMIRGHLDGRGIPLRAKVAAVAMVWLTIPASVLFLVTHTLVRIVLVFVGLCVTVYLVRLPLREEGKG